MLVNYIITFLMIILGIVCLLLIGLVLIQKSKGQGAISFGGGVEAVFGAQMGNVVTRATVVLAILFLVITTALAIMRPRGGSGSTLADRTEAGNTPRAAQTPMDFSNQPLAIPSGDDEDGNIMLPFQTITIPEPTDGEAPEASGDNEEQAAPVPAPEAGAE